MEELTAAFVEDLKILRARSIEKLTQVRAEMIIQHNEPPEVMDAEGVQKLRQTAFQAGANIEVIKELDMVIVKLEGYITESWQKALMLHSTPLTSSRPATTPLSIGRG